MNSHTTSQTIRTPSVCCTRLTVTAVLIAVCLVATAFADSNPSTSAADDSLLQQLCHRQQSEITSYAALLRVKIRHEGRIDDFRTEIFAVGDSLLSVYVRGFLGHSAFKAVLSGDSLLVYFPSEHKYFSGLRTQIDTGDLRDAEHVTDYLLSVLRGVVSVPTPSSWQDQIIVKSRHVTIKADDLSKRCNLRVECAIDNQRFPYQRLESLELRSSNDKLHINVKVQSSHFNREIPPEKFAVDVAPGSIQINQNELVEMLTGSAH